MNAILKLFLTISSNLGIVTMFLPIVAVLIARKKNVKLNRDLKLFEFYVYLTLILQLIAVIMGRGFGLKNLFLFRLYLPIHTAIFSYFLLKWLLIKNNKIMLFIGLVVIISILGDYLIHDSISTPYFMVAFDAVLLLGLSFFDSYINDKKKVHLAEENNFIHLGIYLYSILTLLGFVISQTGYLYFGFFLQSLAVIISNYYFTRSFICLFHSRG